MLNLFSDGTNIFAETISQCSLGSSLRILEIYFAHTLVRDHQFSAYVKLLTLRYATVRVRIMG